MALVDVIAPSDFVLGSPIGKADGEVRGMPPVATEAWLESVWVLRRRAVSGTFLEIVTLGELSGDKRNQLVSQLLATPALCLGYRSCPAFTPTEQGSGTAVLE